MLQRPPEHLVYAPLQTTAIVFLLLAWIGVFLRCYVRKVVVNRFAIDDWFMLLSVALYTVLVICTVLAAQNGFGQHTQDLESGLVVRAMSLFYVGELLYNAATVVIKIAFALFYYRMAKEKWMKRLLVGIMVFCVLFGIGYGLCLALQCLPVSYVWTRFSASPAHGHCLPPRVLIAATFSHSAINATIDWTLGLLPIRLLWNTKMNLKTKMSVGFILALGVFASISTIIRMFYINGLAEFDDLTYYARDLTMWSVIEPSLGLLAGGLAVSRPLVLPILRSFGLNRPRKPIAAAPKLKHPEPSV